MKNKCNKIKFLFFFYVICELNFSTNTIISNNKKNIFTFWEPVEKMPGYLKLCMKTWKKFLPDYKIIILDYKSLKNNLGESLFNDIICKNMSLAVQADAIRVALLNKYGGVWIDTDTIILNGDFIKAFKNYELTMIRDTNSSYHYNK